MFRRGITKSHVTNVTPLTTCRLLTSMNGRCADFENYVKEVEHHKRNILLLNKADFLSVEQRDQWVIYFKEKNIEFLFWSANQALEEAERAAAAAAAAEDSDSDGVDPGAESDEGEEPGAAPAPAPAPRRDLLSTNVVVTREELLDHLELVAGEVRPGKRCRGRGND